MSAANWADYIRAKSTFYGDVPARARADGEFTWSMTSRPPTWKRHLKKVPVIGPRLATRQLEKRNPVQSIDQLPKADVSAIYEARSLLEDEVSRMMFDEAMIVRLVSHHRYFVARHAFADIAEKVSEAPFSEPGLPSRYVGLPLKRYSLKVGDRTADVIGADRFPDMLNKWQQYLVKRDGLDFTPTAGQVVLDCGACVGDVSTVFASMVGPSGKVFGFDPVPLHIRFCELQRTANPSLAPAMHFVQAAIGNEDRAGKNATSERTEIDPGELNIEDFAMTRIDTFAKERQLDRVDLIKMDIEGAEQDALVGAAQTIRDFKPRLAISTYHRPDDFWKIPLQIRDMGLGYKFAFGHHSPRNWESVIYAY